MSDWMSGWIDLMKARLGSEDSVQKTFYANYGRTAGYIVMSKGKLFFLEEKGFLRKTWNIILEVPYEKIREVTTGGPDLTITDAEGKRHTFRIFEIDASIVEKHLKELMPVPGATS